MQPRLTAAELAGGIQFGRDQSVFEELGRRQERAVPRSASGALVEVIAQTLTGRSYVLFSGGIDSSLVLSATAQACREAGVPPPVPVTFRHPGHPEADESQFQVAVIRHLDLDDWLILTVDEELDVLGDVSRRELSRWGPSVFARLPAMAWMFEQLPERGVVLSGEGGDQVLAASPLARAHFARGAIRSRRHRRQALAELGRWPMIEWHRRRMEPIAWLTPCGRAEVLPRLRALERGGGQTMSSLLRHHRSKRYVVTVLDELTAQAARYGMGYLAPLLDLGFIADLTASIPDRHFINRNLTVHHHFAGMLPRMVEQRTTKARFRTSVNGTPTRGFAARWNGDGVPLDLVEPEVLRQVWLDGSDARAWLMLQHAWLATEGAG